MALALRSFIRNDFFAVFHGVLFFMTSMIWERVDLLRLARSRLKDENYFRERFRERQYCRPSVQIASGFYEMF